MSDASDEPDDQKQPKVFTEEAKQRHVSHWDLDYLPADEVAEAYNSKEPAAAPAVGSSESIQVADDGDFIPKEEYEKTAAKKAHKPDPDQS